MQPEHVQELFPAVLTHRSAIDRKLLQLMRIMALDRIKLKAFRDMLRQMQSLRVTSCQIQFVSVLLRMKKFPGDRLSAQLLTPAERMCRPDIDWAAIVGSDLPTLKSMGGFIPSGKRDCSVMVFVWC